MVKRLVKLKSFQVQNFRSIAKSGSVNVDQITALVGRNESGKSNLLLALASLNPPGGPKILSRIKDFPRDRRLQDCTDNTELVETVWELTEAEKAELARLLPMAPEISTVHIGRYYKAEHWVDLGLERPKPDTFEIRTCLRKLEPLITIAIEHLPEGLRPQVQNAWALFRTAAETFDDPDWSENTTSAARTLHHIFARTGITFPAAAEEPLGKIEDRAEAIASFDHALGAAHMRVLNWLPRFIYIAEFPEISGHRNLHEYIQHCESGEPLSEGELNFEKMAKVAGFDPRQLYVLGENHEIRNQIMNHAGAAVTRAIRRLWKDRDLKVRFNLDGAHLEILVSDPNNNGYDVEINLDERSRGFRWFFSFYLTFAADTDSGKSSNVILLLDEPGLYLHATSQANLLTHLRADFDNQIIYTTHSPFMVPADTIGAVRTVNFSPADGTTVTNTPTGDARTLFPLHTALGYNSMTNLFSGAPQLIVKNISDYWILSSVSEYLRTSGGKALPPELVVTPAGGAQQITHMMALLSSQQLEYIILLSGADAGRSSKVDLLASKLIRDHHVTFVSEAFPPGTLEDADVEDLIEPLIYEALVRESYRTELAHRDLELDASTPRMVKRIEDGFAALGMTFNRNRPARLFMACMGNRPEQVMPRNSRMHFERLFDTISRRMWR